PICSSPISTGSRLRPGRCAASAWYPGSMKSGPTLNGATRRPARSSAPIKPVATVVFPLPDAGAAMTTAGVDLLTPVAFSRELGPRASWGTQSGAFPRRVGEISVCSREEGSPFDALLALAAHIHRVLDLRHLGDEVGGV